MAKRMKSRKENKYSAAYVYGVKCQPYREPLAIGKDGYLCVDFSPDGSNARRMMAHLPLVSVWENINSSSQRAACKAHAVVPPSDAETEELRNGRLLAEVTWENIFLYCTGTPMMALTVDEHKTVMRYSSEAIPFLSYSDDFGKYTPIYDNKAEAMKAVFEAVGRYSNTKLAGIDYLDCSKLPDDLLTELGFTEIKDILGRGISMWTGDADYAFTLGESSYSNRYSSWNKDWNKEKAEKIENVNSFLDILESTISA